MTFHKSPFQMSKKFHEYCVVNILQDIAVQFKILQSLLLVKVTSLSSSHLNSGEYRELFKQDEVKAFHF